MHQMLTLEQARKCIYTLADHGPSEHVPLAEGVDRITALPHRALCDIPDYPQSSHDGYVVSKKLSTPQNGCHILPVTSEIAAGDIIKKYLQKDSACRIMTGAVVPGNSLKIVPQEFCHEQDGYVRIPVEILEGGRACVHRRGRDMKKGQVVVSKGVPLSPFLLAKLADAGHSDVVVHRRLVVSFYCSGSELVEHPGDKCSGQKVSSNPFLLRGLIKNCQALASYHGLVVDEASALKEKINEIALPAPQVIISTGGMGPGKYDLVENSFLEAGGRVVFTQIRMRPGKAVLFGTLNDSLYFGLPGPPSAVCALFHELIRPALMRFQGDGKPEPVAHRAVLDKDMAVTTEQVTVLKEGVFSNINSTIHVSPSNDHHFNCYILCPPGRKIFRKGRQVTIHPL